MFDGAKERTEILAERDVEAQPAALGGDVGQRMEFEKAGHGSYQEGA